MKDFKHYYLYETTNEDFNKDVSRFVELRYLAVRGKLRPSSYEEFDTLELKIFGYFETLESMGTYLERAYHQYRDKQNALADVQAAG